MSEGDVDEPRTERVSRRRLLAAARRSFVARGYGGTSLDAIIDEVGGSRRNIYTEFGGKDGLLRAVMREIIEEIAAEAETLAATVADEPREWLVAVGLPFVRRVLDPESIAVLRQLIAVGAPDEEIATLWRAGPERFRATLATWLRAQHASGRLRVPDPDAAAAMLPEMLRGGLHLELLLGRRQAVPEDELRRQVERAVALFLAALEPPPRARRRAKR